MTEREKKQKKFDKKKKEKDHKKRSDVFFQKILNKKIC